MIQTITINNTTIQSKYTNVCCLCFGLLQGFQYLVYLDISKFVWGFICTLLIFLDPSSIYIDRLCNTATIITILMQSLIGIYCIKKGFPNRDYYIYNYYFLTKISSILACFMEYVIKLPLKCHLNLEFSSNCETRIIAIRSIFIMAWLILESYWAYIIFIFYKKHIENENVWRYGLESVNWNSGMNLDTVGIMLEANGFMTSTASSSCTTDNRIEIKGLNASDIAIGVPLEEINKAFNKTKSPPQCSKIVPKLDSEPNIQCIDVCNILSNPKATDNDRKLYKSRAMIKLDTILKKYHHMNIITDGQDLTPLETFMPTDTFPPSETVFTEISCRQ